MNAEHLLTHFDRLTDAPDAIPRLRRFILDLAVRGKLVEQDPEDEPASELLKRIAAEKKRLVEAGEIRKPKPLAPVNKTDHPFELPNGWVATNLGNASTQITKGSTPTSYGHAYTDTGVNFVKVEAIRDNLLRPGNITSHISATTHNFLARSQLADGDVLFSIAGSIGTCALVTSTILPANTNQAIAIIRGTKQVFFSKFLLLALQSSVVTHLTDVKARGGAMNNISLGDVARFIIPLPPLAEQHRIVAKVDELIALCDRLETARKERETTRDRLATASLARLNAPDPDPAVLQEHTAFVLNNLTPLTTRPDQIKVLRQTILNLAVRGKLVEQDSEDESAGELLKRIAGEKRRMVEAGEIKKAKALPEIALDETPFAAPYGWEWVRLASSTIIVQGFAFSSGSFSADPDAGYPLIKIGDIGTSAPEVFIKGSYDPTYLVNRGDILLGLSGSIKCAIWEGPTALLNQRIARIAPVSSDLLSAWLLFGVNTCIDKWKDETSKLTVQNVKARQLYEALIPLPPLAEQRRIVAKVDELMMVCDRLEASLARGEETRGRLVEAVLWEALETDGEVAA